MPVSLFQSRRFWTFILATLSAGVLLVVELQWPASLEMAKVAVDLVGKLALILIAAFTVDDTVKSWIAYRMAVIQRTIK